MVCIFSGTLRPTRHTLKNFFPALTLIVLGVGAGGANRTSDGPQSVNSSLSAVVQ